ncbi:MAG: hypothetical protein ACYSU7_09165, partial [Planctomycetota bacterium]
MSLAKFHMMFAVTALLAGVAVAQTDTTAMMTSGQRAEFSKLVHQRNSLYTQLENPGARGYYDTGNTKQVQNQLDTIEHRLGVLATQFRLEVPPRPVPVSRKDYSSGSPTVMGDLSTVTPKQRAEFNKLVLRRNKLHAQLTRLDEQASELIKRGREPV